MYDMTLQIYGSVAELITWKRGYDGGPLDTGPKVVKFVDDTRNRLDELSNKIRSVSIVCTDCPHIKSAASDSDKQNKT